MNNIEPFTVNSPRALTTASTTCWPGPGGTLICHTVVVEEMACAELVERATDHLEGALDEQDVKRLTSHLRVCRSCDEFIAQLKAAIRVAGSLPGEELPGETEAELVELYHRWQDGRDER